MVVCAEDQEPTSLLIKTCLFLQVFKLIMNENKRLKAEQAHLLKLDYFFLYIWNC